MVRLEILTMGRISIRAMNWDFHNHNKIQSIADITADKDNWLIFFEGHSIAAKETHRLAVYLLTRARRTGKRHVSSANASIREYKEESK